LMIVIGLWEFAGGVLKVQERVGANCTDAVATSFLSEGPLQIRRLSTLGAPDVSEKSKLAEENDKSSETGTLQTEAAS